MFLSLRNIILSLVVLAVVWPMASSFGETRPVDHGDNASQFENSTSKSDSVKSGAQNLPPANKPRVSQKGPVRKESAVLGRSSTPTSTQQSAVPQPTLTRGEALVVGLKRLEIPREALNEISEITRDREQLSVDQLASVVDAMTELPPVVLSKEQGTQLKRLLQEELGSVEDLNLGQEVSQAVSQILKEDPPASSEGDPIDPSVAEELSKNDDRSNFPEISRLDADGVGSLDKLLNSRFGDVLGKNSPDKNDAEKGGAKANEAVAEKLAKADELLKKLESSKEQLGQFAQRQASPGGGILNAIQSALADLKEDDDKKEKGDSDLSGIDQALKDALSHDPSKLAQAKKDDDDDDRKNDKQPPPPEKPEKEKKNPLEALLKAIKKDKKDDGKEASNSDKKGGGGEFSLPEAKEPEPEETAKNSELSDLAKGEENLGEQEPGDPSQLLDALKAAKGTPKTTSLDPVSGGGGSGGFGGGFGGDPFGGAPTAIGITGPNIVGGGSAPAGGAFDGDPFGGLGQGGFGGPGAGFSLSKKVSYGSSSGSADAGDGESGEVDGGAYSPAVARRKKNQSARLEIAPVKKASMGSLLDYIGNLSSTLCSVSRGADVEICKRLSAKKYLSNLRKRKSSTVSEQ